MNLFFFEGKNDSYTAGIIHVLATNTLILIGILTGYFLVKIFDVASVSILYLSLYALNLNLFSSQLYFWTATLFANAPSYRYKKDLGALIASFVTTLLVACFSIHNLNMFEASHAGFSRLELSAIITVIILGGTLLKNKTITGVSFTEEEKDVDEKTFFIDKKKLKNFEWSWWGFPVILLGVFFYILKYFGL